ncbi:hypothetical protein LJC42_04720 [Eubacteriales bacterium OttesenSCG-928-K08]|nr:hypothetical protein [Eubacteriales bacterium OttesenSCG-928-K08]
MELSTLNTIFTICITAGFGIPVLNIVLSWVGSSFDFSFDGDFELDGIFPFNILCLCLLLVVFGALGKLFLQWMSSTLLVVLFLLLALALGICGYVLLYKLVIKKLRQNEPIAMMFEQVPGQRGEVTLRINEDSIGTISVRDSTGAFISFRAKIDPTLKSYIGETIPQGTAIVVTGVDEKEKLCYVSTIDWQFGQEKTN